MNSSSGCSKGLETKGLKPLRKEMIFPRISYPTGQTLQVEYFHNFIEIFLPMSVT